MHAAPLTGKTVPVGLNFLLYERGSGDNIPHSATRHKDHNGIVFVGIDKKLMISEESVNMDHQLEIDK